VSDQNEIAPELVARVEAAAAGAIDLHSIAARLKVRDDERQLAPGHLQAAFEYSEASPGPEPVAVGRYFGPMMEFGGRRYPPPLEALPGEWVVTWHAAADQVSSPLASARLNDLCFEAGLGERGARARQAITAYLAASEELSRHSTDESGDQRRYTRLEALSRARQLARTIGDAEHEQHVVQAILGAAEASVSANDAGYAVLFLQLLAIDSPPVDGVFALLNQAKGQLAGDPLGREEAVRTQLRLNAVEEATRQQLRRELVDAIAEQADRMEGIARAHHLERAISEARDAGLQDLVNELTVRIQELSASGELDLTAHEFGFSVPREQVERWLEKFLSAPDWQQSLLRLTAAPPSGRVEENRLEAEAERQAHPIRWLATNAVVGGDGLPRFTPSNDDELREYQLTDYEMRKAQLHAIFLPELFVRIWGKWGPLESSELASFFAGGAHVGDALAQALGRDLHRLFTGDYEGALYTGSAHIETLARHLVLASTQPAYRTQRTNAPGQYIGLGALLSTLRVAGLDESWTRYLHGLLSSPMGLNHRNELLHGFELETNEATAALLFVGIIYLARAVGVSRPETTDEQNAGDAEDG
jgi:hypothetical protein